VILFDFQCTLNCILGTPAFGARFCESEIVSVDSKKNFRVIIYWKCDYLQRLLCVDVLPRIILSIFDGIVD